VLRRAEGVPERMLGAGCWSDPCTNSCRAQGRARAHARHELTPKLAHRWNALEPSSQRHIWSASRFLNHHLVQRAHVGYELSRLSHHLVDGLMGHRNLVEDASVFRYLMPTIASRSCSRVKVLRAVPREEAKVGIRHEGKPRGDE